MSIQLHPPPITFSSSDTDNTTNQLHSSDTVDDLTTNDGHDSSIQFLRPTKKITKPFHATTPSRSLFDVAEEPSDINRRSSSQFDPMFSEERSIARGSIAEVEIQEGGEFSKTDAEVDLDNNLPENLPEVNKAPTIDLCGNCEENNATVWCEDCDMKLCEEGDCDKDLHSMKKLAHHIRVPLEAATNLSQEIETEFIPAKVEEPVAAAKLEDPIETTNADTKICENCEESVGSIYCDECEMYLCIENNCDHEMHQSSKMQSHTRKRV
jgi:hypothetical protein